MKSEVTLSIKLGLSVTVTCISTVSHDRLRFRNKLKLYRREDAPKFATQKIGGVRRLSAVKQRKLISVKDDTRGVHFKANKIYQLSVLRVREFVAKRVLFAATLLRYHVNNSTMAKFSFCLFSSSFSCSKTS